MIKSLLFGVLKIDTASSRDLKTSQLIQFPILIPIPLHNILQLACNIDGSRPGHIEMSRPLAHFEPESFLQDPQGGDIENYDGIVTAICHINAVIKVYDLGGIVCGVIGDSVC